MLDVASAPGEDEMFLVDARIVGCDGGGGPLGHPLVYLHIEDDGAVVCPYCSRRFVLADGAGTADHH